MDIVMKNVEELIPYENNPRINDHAVEYVINSIKQFGFKVPIVVDKNNVIVTGHTRLKAAKELEMKRVPVLVADDLSEEQIQAFRLADNKVGEIAEWDEDALAAELEELSHLDINMDLFYFEEIAETLDIDDEVIGEPQASYDFVLKVGSISVVLTEKEYESLEKRLDEYVEENGVSFGFVGDLLWK